jgi:hypothetical protein
MHIILSPGKFIARQILKIRKRGVRLRLPFKADELLKGRTPLLN